MRARPFRSQPTAGTRNLHNDRYGAAQDTLAERWPSAQIDGY